MRSTQWINTQQAVNTSSIHVHFTALEFFYFLHGLSKGIMVQVSWRCERLRPWLHRVALNLAVLGQVWGRLTSHVRVWQLSLASWTGRDGVAAWGVSGCLLVRCTRRRPWNLKEDHRWHRGMSRMCLNGAGRFLEADRVCLRPAMMSTVESGKASIKPDGCFQRREKETTALQVCSSPQLNDLSSHRKKANQVGGGRI